MPAFLIQHLLLKHLYSLSLSSDTDAPVSIRTRTTKLPPTALQKSSFACYNIGKTLAILLILWHRFSTQQAMGAGRIIFLSLSLRVLFVRLSHLGVRKRPRSISFVLPCWRQLLRWPGYLQNKQLFVGQLVAKCPTLLHAQHLLHFLLTWVTHILTSGAALKIFLGSLTRGPTAVSGGGVQFLSPHHFVLCPFLSHLEHWYSLKSGGNSHIVGKSTNMWYSWRQFQWTKPYLPFQIIQAPGSMPFFQEPPFSHRVPPLASPFDSMWAIFFRPHSLPTPDSVLVLVFSSWPFHKSLNFL